MLRGVPRLCHVLTCFMRLSHCHLAGVGSNQFDPFIDPQSQPLLEWKDPRSFPSLRPSTWIDRPIPDVVNAYQVLPIQTKDPSTNQRLAFCREVFFLNYVGVRDALRGG